MKKLGIITLALLALLSTAHAGEGSSAGGGSKISTNVRIVFGQGGGGGPRISIDDIQSIETIDRRIIFKEEIEVIFKVEDQKLILDERMLNIEAINGEVLSII